MTHHDLSRRNLLKLALASGLLSGTQGLLRPQLGHAQDPSLQSVDPKDRKLLFIFGAWGGASIIDSFLPVAESETFDLLLAQTLNVFPDAQLEQVGAFKVPKPLDSYGIFKKPTYTIADFARAHGQDLSVVTQEVSSVNHSVGQQRSLSGAGINRGRTLMEAMSLRYGGGMVLPNCNMASDGYIRHGADPTIPPEARHELISSPLMFATGTHGSRGVVGAPDAAAMERVRQLRGRLEQESIFGRTFENDARRRKFLESREKLSPKLESAGVVDKLLLVDPSTVDPKYGVTIDPTAAKVRGMFENIETDSAEAQLALGFLLAYHGVSTSVTMGYSQDAYITPAGGVVGAPIAFDFSHNNHRQAQSVMWSRLLQMLDTFINLLKTHDYMGDPSLGKMWDRSLVYIATEFGRDKKRPLFASSWGTGHDLNNGCVLISPLLKGNAVYGGVDPKTCLTYGFDPQTGSPDTSRVMGEADVYGIIADALDLDSPPTGRYPAIVKS